jgi:hypothetical protein
MTEVRKKIVNDIDEICKKIDTRIGGPGFGEKTYLIAFLIYHLNCKTTLDLGVFTGGSLFPQATMHNKYTKGIVYGVDPYIIEGMINKDIVDPVYLHHQEVFLSTLDCEELYNHVIEQISNFKYNDNIIFLRQRSDVAVEYFKNNEITFDFMFIDGNHDIDPALNDVKLYIPLLNENGILMMDDVKWETIQPARQYVADNLIFIHEGTDYAIFQKTAKDGSELKLTVDTFLKD